MAHESFADDRVAALLNDGFVAIKVDREERPDVDAVYMSATQAMTGQGGWPMTVFATPAGEPFFCGTYFPREQFARLLTAVGTAWREQREQVLRQGTEVVAAISRAGAREAATPVPVTAADLAAAVRSLAGDFDQVRGGFGGAPKFPPHMCLLFLLRYHQATGDPQALELVQHTCEQMTRGGIHDQLGGGFARYAVDDRWLVPHFEKMLYDNALLLRVYTLLWRVTGDAGAARVALSTADFLLTELSTADGGFASSLDADTGGVEGATYVWTPAQLTAVLGEPDGTFAADLYGVTAAGTFEHGTSVLRLTRDLTGADEQLQARAGRVRAALYAARATRPQPGRDDKVVAAWAGLAVTALVEAVDLAREVAPDRAEDLAEAAVRAAGYLARVHLVDGRLRRVSRDGVAGEPAGVLDDHGAVAEAFCAVHQLTGQGHWLELAGRLLDVALARFADGRGGWYDTADDAEELITRPADPTDNATPSGASALAAGLTGYAALAGRPAYRQAAQDALAGLSGLIARHARFAGYAAAVAQAQVTGPYEVAIVADTGGELLAAARRTAPHGSVVVSGVPDQPGVPLLAGRPAVGGGPTAYVCRGFVCDRPVTDPRSLQAQLGG